jgi:hypothetical protein
MLKEFNILLGKRAEHIATRIKPIVKRTEHTIRRTAHIYEEN